MPAPAPPHASLAGEAAHAPRGSRNGRRRTAAVLAAGLAFVLSGCGLASGSSSGPTVRVFSARTYGNEEAYQRFRQETGIAVEILSGSDAELRERLQAEGEDTQADVYLTVDVANLALATRQDLLRPVASPALEQAVPATLRDPQGRWFGLSERARVVLYNKDRVEPSQLSTYDALGDPRWRGRLCLRTSTSAYTQSLVAALIAHEGEQGARRTVQGWMDNEPQILANDVEIIRTLAAGGCDVGVTNHYYLARELAKDPRLPVALSWPNQRTTGVHVNISGAGVTKNAPHPDLGQRFLEWLATSGQPLFVEGNYEYPVNPSVAQPELLKSFGPYTRDRLNVGELGAHNAAAVRVLTETGYR